MKAFTLNACTGGQIGKAFERLDKLRPAIGIARVIDCVDADKNLPRTQYLGPAQRKRQEQRVACRHVGHRNTVLRPFGHRDAIIGAVLIPGAKAPSIIFRDHLKLMKPGALIVDVAVDQGGCVETTRPTTHDDPVFSVDGIMHYCVANMPGAVPLTSTLALTGTTLPYGLQIADQGLESACRHSPALRQGLNTYAGRCTCPAVADAFNIEYTPFENCI